MESELNAFGQAEHKVHKSIDQTPPNEENYDIISLDRNISSPMKLSKTHY